jgi:hypothetical protein
VPDGSGFRPRPISRLPTLSRVPKAVSGCALGAQLQPNAEYSVRMEIHLLLSSGRNVHFGAGILMLAIIFAADVLCGWERII